MRNRLVGAIIILAAAIALTVTLLTSYSQRRAAECQADVNTQFLDVQRQRARINDGDRDATRELFETIVNASEQASKGKITPKQAQDLTDAAIVEYFNDQEELDKQRENNPLPMSIKCGQDGKPIEQQEDDK